MPDADDAACLYAFRRWRDESGLALEAARLGVAVDYPRCPVLVMASELDKDVPMVVSRELATRCSADFRQSAGLQPCRPPARPAPPPGVAEQAAEWLAVQTAHRRSGAPLRLARPARVAVARPAGRRLLNDGLASPAYAAAAVHIPLPTLPVLNVQSARCCCNVSGRRCQ